jgi:hypothetical protein
MLPSKYLAFLPAVVLLAAQASAQLDGAFTLRQADDGRVQLNLQYEDGRSNYGRSIERGALTDVSQQGDRVTFALKRAAGSFAFEGRGSIDRASGWYVFTPSPDFRRDMDRLGFKDLQDKSLFVFALDDLTTERVRTLQGQLSDTIDTAGLVRLINHGAGPKYVQEMTDAGFRKLSSDEYRRARDHGVTLSFVRGMREAGFKAGLEELVRARDHGVSVDYVRRMSALGYSGLELSDYIRMRDHGVTPEFAESLRDAGLAKLSWQDLVRLRDHGISANFVTRLKDVFKEPPTADQIIRLRTRGEIDR